MPLERSSFCNAEGLGRHYSCFVVSIAPGRLNVPKARFSESFRTGTQGYITC